MRDEATFVDESLLKKVPRWRGYLEAKLGFRNHWYAVRLSGDVGEGQIEKVTLAGENILLKRINSKVYAIRDRCIHRGIPFSQKPECYTPDTITCWYHGFTYRWFDGVLSDILAAPDSRVIGNRKVQTYPVEEAKGVLFVYLGDEGVTPQPLREDVPPYFLDDDMAVEGHAYLVQSNWRLAAENGFDALHVYIHRTSPLLGNTQRGLPIGHIASSAHITVYEEAGEPKGVYDDFEQHSVVYDATVDGNVVVKGTRSSRPPGPESRSSGASTWLPCSARVDNFPDAGHYQFEWYTPVTEDSHYYLILIGKRVNSEAEALAHRQEFWNRWKPLSLEGFNNQDIEARVGLQTFYKDDRAWLTEGLIEADLPIMKWRELCHEHNRGIQTPDHIR